MVLLRTLFLVLWALIVPGLVAAGPVDINRADAQTLAQTLDGVGIHKAKAIVAYREEHGPFKSIDDLTKVKGIGKKTVEKNRDRLTVGSASGETAGQ